MSSNDVLALTIVCLTALAASGGYALYLYEVGRPQYGCSHEYDTKLVFDGTYSNEYLCTCRKCGHQKTWAF